MPGGKCSGSERWRAEFLLAPSADRAGSVVVAGLVKKLVRTLSVSSAEEIDIHKPLHSYGVDSLLSVELRNWFAKKFKAEVADSGLIIVSRLSWSRR